VLILLSSLGSRGQQDKKEWQGQGLPTGRAQHEGQLWARAPLGLHINLVAFHICPTQRLPGYQDMTRTKRYQDRDTPCLTGSTAGCFT
jgi:hypothetical protein